MDPRDFAVYRFLSPQGEARFWGGRRVVDPTIPAREIAERVGLSENGVRARLAGLAARGFLRGTAVTPNPSLFGVRLFVAELPVRTAAEAERLYRDLALVDGVVFARDTLDETDRQLRVYFVAESDSTTARRVALLRRLAPEEQLRGPQPYWIPVCERELSPLDWRLLRAFCLHPDGTIAEIARETHLSPKTAARRYHGLIDARACWWTHGEDSEEFPLALVRVEVVDSAHRSAVAREVLKETTAWMPVAGDGLGIEPGAAATVVAGLVPADAPVALERWVKRVAALPGVASVRRTFALGSRTYPTWFADRVAAHVPQRPGSLARPP